MNIIILAPPTKCWLFGSDELKPGGNVSIDKDDYKTKLVITKATRAHTGNYTLRIKNPAGDDEVTAKVTVLDKPTKPKDLKVYDVHKEGCTLEWKPPEDNGELYFV